MGRIKARKPKKPPKMRSNSVSSALAEYDSQNVWALLMAAGASPTVRQRWSSLGFLVHAAVRERTTGSKSINGTTLQTLLNAVDSENPGYAQQEDYLAPDPRTVVRVRLNDSTVRLFPGSVERPVSDIDRALMLSSAIDAHLLELHGFGIADILRVILGYMDIVVEQFSKVWPAEDPADTDLSITAAELQTAIDVIQPATPKDLISDRRAELALEWMTCDASDLDFEPGHLQSPFGRFLRVRTSPQEKPRWLPLAFLPEILSYAVGELAETAANDVASRIAFAQASAAATRRHLWRFADVLYGAPDLPDGPAVSPHNAVQWLVPLGEQLVVAVQVVSDLEAARIGFQEEFAALTAATAAAKGSGVAIKLAAGEVTLAAGVEVVPLLVVSTPDHIMTSQGGGLASVSLDDLRWMSTTADNEFDLLNFCRDITAPAMARSIGFEAIDYWETWRANGKAFFVGGQTLSVMVIEPHAGDAEWMRSAEWTAAEMALATLGLPALRDTVGVSHAKESPVAVYQWGKTGPSVDADDITGGGPHFRPAAIGWSLHTGPVPVAISAGDSADPNREHRRLLHDMAGSIGFTIEGVISEWVDAHSKSGIRGYVLDQAIKTAQSDGSAQWVSDVRKDQHGVVHATVNVDFERFTDIGDGDAAAIRGEFSNWMRELLLYADVDPLAAESVSKAVMAAPPTMTLNVSQTLTMRNNLSAPVDVDEAFVSSTNTIIAQRVKASGVAPGLYEGEDAKNLDRDVLADIALKLLEERLHDFDCDALVSYGMKQLQRTVENRTRNLENVRHSARELSLSWNPLDRAAQTHAQGHVLRRYNEIVVEASLRSTPSGKKILDEPTWAAILAAAKAYLEATMRSENVHYQVTPTAIRITDLFEISTANPTSVGVDANERAPYQLNAAEYAEATIRDGFDEEWGATPVSDSLREIVDAEMLATFGATPLDIYTTLFCLAGIQYAPTDPEVLTMSVDAAVAWVCDNTIFGETPDGESRVAAAIAMLTSTRDGLQEDDWRPWLARTRLRRLLVRPLPTLSNNELLIAPHFLVASLSVYRNYLEQGQLPWTQPAAPQPLERALERFRDAKNKALEKDVVSLLGSEGWTVVSNIKETKPGRLGLATLSTEIDAVAGRADDPVIHLLEVKDPANVFATPQIRGQLDDFYFDKGKKKSYATQLRRKFDDLAPHADKVAAAMELPPRDPVDPYRVEATFVTRMPIPAAFVNGPFPFLTAGTLLDGLRQPATDGS